MMQGLDREQVEVAYKRIYPTLLAKCTRMLGDGSEARDVAQETFTRLWAQRCSIREPDAVVGWLYKTSTRLAIDRLRNSSREAPADDGTTDLPMAAHASPEVLADAKRALRRLGTRTPPKELEAVILSRIDGLTHPEIARVLGKSERTVRRLLVSFQRRHAAGRS